MVVSILGLVASVLVLGNRLIIRWPWSELLGNDDWVCIAATVWSMRLQCFMSTLTLWR